MGDFTAKSGHQKFATNQAEVNKLNTERRVMFKIKRTRFAAQAILVLFIVSLASLCFAQFGGGQGTQDDPYIVSTATHLNNIRDEFLGEDNYFRQTANIDLDEAPWNEGNGWSPIGDNANRFQGTYDGNGFVITGMTIDRNAQYQGLFGYTQNATLLNITLEEVDIQEGGQHTGALVGRSLTTTVTDCTASGSLTSTQGGRANIGGLLGYASGTITDCSAYVNVTVENGDRIGGFVGDGWGSMRRCYATGDVVGNNRVGGLAGNDYNNHQQGELFATGNVTGNDQVGGLFGLYQTATYYDVYAVGDVTGNDQVGGLVGRSEISANVHRGFAVGRVIGEGDDVGGLIGSEHDRAGTVNNSYFNTESTGHVFSYGGEPRNTAEMLSEETFAGWDFDEDGLWRIADGSYPYLAYEGDEAPDHSYPSNLYLPPSNLRANIHDDRETITLNWDEPSLREPIGYNIFLDGERLNEDLLENEQYIFEDAQEWHPYFFSLSAVYLIDGEQEESHRSGAYRVIITDYAEGDGSEDNPFTIANALQLSRITYFMRSHFIQTADIDLDELDEWVPIGNSQATFQGSFNGNDFTISNLNLQTNASDQGLFGYTSGATLINITIEDVDIEAGAYSGALAGRAVTTDIINCGAYGTIEGSGSRIGGLVGHSTGPITDSYAYVDVNAPNADRVGGLFGDKSGGDVRRSFAAGNVNGSNYVGGLGGYDINANIRQSFAVGNVDGDQYVGGFGGYNSTFRTYEDCYATGNVNGNSDVGGLVGHNRGTVARCYSIGRVVGQNGVGGLVGTHNEDRAEYQSSYWNERTSGQRESAGGEPRDERHMTHPHTADTYVGWDFDATWERDTDNSNRGYPYFPWQPLFRSPFPDIARDPIPEHRAENISVEIDSLKWSYHRGGAFTNPVGFRVYFNDTGEFGDDDDFEWVEYDLDQVDYAISDIIPELDYMANYYWKVVPTTNDPTRSGVGRNTRNTEIHGRDNLTSYRGGDAENVQVWEFATEIYPNPVSATDPNPEHEAEDIEVTLNQLGWSYHRNEEFADPVGFRIYMNTTGDFEEDDDFVWIDFVGNQSEYSTSELLPDGDDRLDYGQTYYWQVVPTTEHPEDGRRSSTRTRNSLRANRSISYARGDADTVHVWSFTTLEREPYPAPAVNPDPEHLAEGISLGISLVSWEFSPSEIHTDPVGFRVYMNTTGAFGANAPYEWIEYEEGETEYSNSDILPVPLDENTTYYWRVIPTTIHPDDERSDVRERRNTEAVRQMSNVRHDAEDVQIWRFVTGTTNVEDDTVIPAVTELHNNYPNPFNPDTNISFSLAEDGQVSVDVFNSRGQKIKTLVNDYLQAGNHNIIWDGRDENNSEVSSGIYFYRMEKGDFTSTNKMIMMK